MSKEPTSQLQLSDVSVVVHRKPACRVELEVKASSTLVQQARKQAIKLVGKEVVHPGYRKGHAPDEIVMKNYPSAIENQWHKAIADLAFPLAQQHARVPMLNTNIPITFDLKKHSLEDGAELTYSFDTEPTVPTVDPKLFQPKLPQSIELGDKEIDEAIHQMRFFYAKWDPITDRGIQEGDYIVIDLDSAEEPSQKIFNNVRFEVSKARMAEWMQKLVIGAKAGDILEGVSEPDANATEEEKKEFTPKKIRLTVHLVEAATLPEMEEFISKMGVKTEEELRTNIKNALEQNVKEKQDEALRDQINDFLIHQYTFELPLSLIETEKNHRKNQLENNPQYKESLEKMSVEEKKKFDEKLFTESDQAVRLFYLSRQIVRDAKIPVTHNEVQEEAIRSANSFGKTVDPSHLPNEIFALALSKIVLAKAQNYILENYSKGGEPAPVESGTAQS